MNNTRVSKKNISIEEFKGDVDIEEYISNHKRAIKEIEIIELLKNGEVLKSSITSNSLSSLIKKGIIEKYSEEYYRLNDNNEIEDLVTLNKYQNTKKK